MSAAPDRLGPHRGPPVLLTGGTGVVGGAVLDALLDAGHAVRALVRSTEAADRMAARGVEPVLGDVLDEGSLARAVEGCDTVFHVAGVNAMCLRDPAPMYQVNVDGTRNVVRRCHLAGVRRLVHTSSAVTIGERRGEVGTEDTVYRGYVLSHYERSKLLAEQVVFAERGPTEVVAVNPSSVQGPGRATGTAKLILDVARGRIPVLVDTTFGVVDIHDCARGHLLAADRGRPGRRYILNGFTTTTREAVELFTAAAGIDVDVRYVPGPLLYGLVVPAELVARVARREPRFCREMLRTMLHGHRYDGSRATRELGLAYTPAEVTIREMVAWFRAEGLL